MDSSQPALSSITATNHNFVYEIKYNSVSWEHWPHFEYSEATDG